MLLGRKLLRELRAQKGQTAAVLAVTALGVLLFVASGAAYLDLRDSYAHTRHELALAGLDVGVVRVTPDQVDRVRRLPGVRQAEARVVTEVPIRIPHRELRMSLRILSIPDAGEPALDRVLVTAGRLPHGADEILVEKHLAQSQHLAAGDTILVDGVGGSRTLTVAGIGESAEYLWLWRDDNDVFPNPDAFGVAWMSRSALRQLSHSMRSTSREPASLTIADSDGDGNELLIEPASPPRAASLADEIKELLGADAVLRVTPADRIVGVRLLQMDVDGYKGMAAFFPIFFLGVGAFIVASIVARLVDAQRAIVGTLAALGVGRARVLGHYLAFALTLCGAGALLGAAASTAVAPAMTRAYADDLGIPFVSTRLHWDLVGEGILAALSVGLLAGLVPALRASRMPPAEAMRPARPSAGVLARLARRMRGPLSVRLAVRDLLGRPLRSLATAVGVAAALVLVLVTGGMLDSMTVTFDSIFESAHRYDLRVDFARPERLEIVNARFGSAPGVERCEGLAALPANLGADGHEQPALLQGLIDGGTLLRSLDLDGREVAPAPGGIVLTRALARALGVERGSEVRVRVPLVPGAAEFRVTGFADAALGNTATVRLDDLQRAYGATGYATSVVLRARPGEAAQVKRAVSQAPDAAHVEDAAALREQMGAMMALGWVFLFLMLGCGVVLATAILFNTATLGILERQRELATLRALGLTLREIAIALTAEHAVLALLGLGLGVPLAILTTKRVLRLYSNDLFSLPFVFSARTVLAACVGVVAILLLAQWPALRRLSRASLAETVRAREG